MESIEITAGSVKEALQKGAQQLGISEDECEYELVKESGLIKKKYTVKISEKPKGEKAALEFIRGVIARMGFDCTVEMKKTDDGFLYEISGEDVAHVIGYRGDVLDSLQYLALLVANAVEGFDGRVIVDGENYREKRVQILTKLARRLAFKAAKSGETIKLEPMNPFERRVIHSALSEDKFVSTHSEGEEPFRCVVIVPDKHPKRERKGGERPRRERRERSENAEYPRVSESNIKYHTDMDLYDAEASRNFKKKGFGKTKSYGVSKRKF